MSTASIRTTSLAALVFVSSAYPIASAATFRARCIYGGWDLGIIGRWLFRSCRVSDANLLGGGMLKKIRCRGLGAAVLLCLAQLTLASEVKVGLEIGVEGEGFLFNPVVTKINVTGVEPESLAARAGIVKGDEITSIEGQVVKGRRASELKAYMKFGAGESRTLVVRHPDGASFEAKLTKPKE